MEPLGAKAFDVEGGKGDPAGKRLPQKRLVDRPAAVGGDVAEKAAGKGVAGPGRVDHLLKGVGRQREETFRRVQGRPELGLLADDRLGAEGKQPLGGGVKGGEAGQFPQLGVVEDHAVHLADRRLQFPPLPLDPDVHRVERGEPGRGDLGAHPPLEARLDVGQKQDVGPAGPLRKGGVEVGEDAQPRLVGCAACHVEAVLPPPKEGLPLRHPLDPRDVDPPLAQDGELLLAEVAADPADDVDLVEEGGSQREVDGRPAKHLLPLRKRRAHRVKGNRTDNRDHAATIPGLRSAALAPMLGLMAKRFDQLGLKPETLAVLRQLGYREPTPIQELAIPPLLEGRDLIGQAQTGTGKTAAFGLPLVESFDPSLPEVQGLVLTPTRELCIQVTQALRAYGAGRGLQVVALFGGAPIRGQELQLRKGAHAVVGTVGRLRDLIFRGALILHDARYVVLDEADEMLDLGFLEEVEQILKATPNGRQTALFSATIPPEIERLADRYLYEPVVVKVEPERPTIDTVEQFKLEVSGQDKEARLLEVLERERPTQAIVFVRTKLRCEQLYRALRAKGLAVRALHGDMTQGQRDGVMLAFKEGSLPLLVATDVAARGLDISTVTHVINFDVPLTPETYVHRIGRTGRIGREGRAITLIEPAQRKQWNAIERELKVSVPAWRPGATSGQKALARPRRHEKPREAQRREEPTARLLVGAGRAHGLSVAELIELVAQRTGIDGEELAEVVVLERFSLFSLPASRVEEVLEGLAETELRGRPLKVVEVGAPEREAVPALS